MKETSPVCGSLGSNYTFKFACQTLWWYCLPPNKSKMQLALAEQLHHFFPDFSQGYFFATGRDAIQFALQNVAIPRGAKVLTQAFSCAAIEEAICGADLRPVYVDLEERSVNLSVETIQAAFDAHPDAKVVLVQHVLGCPADVAAIRTWCDAHGVLLIEDLAQAFGGVTQSGEPLGSFGQVIVVSFGRDKILDAVAGGCCLFRQGSLAAEPARQPLRSRSTWRQAVYPLLSVVIRKTFTFRLGKLLQRSARQVGIMSSPVLRTTAPLEKLSVGQARLVLEQLAKLPAALAHRSLIASVYARLLQKYVVSPKQLPNPGSLLRFPLTVRDSDALASSLKKYQFYLSDRWYRAAVDSGSLAFKSVYETGTCPRAETLARSVFTLPTHQHISVETAVRLATTIHSLLDEQNIYVVTEITEQDVWEQWLARRPEANFLQSWQWGEFQQRLGNKIARLGLYCNGTLAGVAQGIFEHARRGTYCSLPGGPLIDWHDPFAVYTLFSELVTVAQKQGCTFIRFRPQLLDDAVARTIVAQFGAVHSAMHVTADRTVEINITESDEALLAGMRKKTRSAIRKSQQLGITTQVSRDPARIQEFYEQQRLVAQRQKFVPFSYQFLHKQFQIFAQHNQALLVSAYQGSQLLATAFILLYHRQAVYHYGISTEENSKLPGAYAVQWRVIAAAKKQGCTSYNLWGVAPPGMDKHRFAGVSIFKRGFGGREVQYLEAHDIPLRSTYWVTRWFELLRKWHRHL